MSSLPNVAPVSGLSPSAAVPGVYQPPQTSATGSSVTASPDVTGSGTISGAAQTVALAVSGHAGVGVSFALTGFTGGLTPQVSYDGGVTYANSLFFDAGTFTFFDAGLTFVANTSMQGYTLFAPAGVTHVRISCTAYTAGSVVVLLTATASPSAIGTTVINSLQGTPAETHSGGAGGFTGVESGLVVFPLPTDSNVASLGGVSFGLPASSPLRLGGTPFTLRAAGTAGGFSPPVVTATQPPQTVMTFSGKIPGATVNNYVIDAVVIRVLGPASVNSNLFGRVVKRHVLYASTQTAAPAAGAVPTGAALAYTGAANGGGTYQYKYVAVDIWGNEGNYSAASLNVAPAANNGVTVTMPAVPAGAAGYNVYRTVTGPGATWFFLGRTNTTTFRDITPDSALTLAAGTIGAWGTLPAIETVVAPMELVMEKFVALTGTAPVIVSTKTFPGTRNNNRVVTIAPGAAVGRYRIPGEVEAKAFLAAPTITTALARDIDANYTYGGKTQINAAFGDIAVNSFNLSDAGMGGTFVVWGHELVGVTDATVPTTYNGVAVIDAGITEGSTLTMKWVAPPVFVSTDEIAVEIGASVTAVSTSLEVMVSGRYF